MAKPNLSRMDFESLVDLRKQVDELLLKRRADIEAQLGRISALTGERVRGRGRRASTLKGRKVPPKYRGPGAGQTWAGRGVKPKWMVEQLKQGKKIDDFLIDKSARKGRKKRKSKR